MIEIIPNWHPIFVHFTIALFSTAVGFFVLSYVTRRFKIIANIAFVFEWEIAARWCLWVAALITIATITAGFYAYYTVKHDAISHAAMTIHRNWALLTATTILLMAGWSVWCSIKHKRITLIFVIALLVAESLLLTTAWHGGELVYRYGIGVMSQPTSEEAEHHH